MAPAATGSIKLLTLPYKYKNWSESIYSLHLSDFLKVIHTENWQSDSSGRLVSDP